MMLLSPSVSSPCRSFQVQFADAGNRLLIPSLLPCSSWSNKLIHARDFASVQINVGHLDESGVYNGKYTTFALAGKVRAMVCAQLLFAPPPPNQLYI